MKDMEERKNSLEGVKSGKDGHANKIKIAVLGTQGVGKSALTVRYLTRRFIGEYKSCSDMMYRQKLTVNNGVALDIEIIDVSNAQEPTQGVNCSGIAHNVCSIDLQSTSEENKILAQDQNDIPKADAYIIVYSVIDRNSYESALNTLSIISSSNLQPSIPLSTASRNFGESSSRESSPSFLSSSSNLAGSVLNLNSGNCPIVLVGNKNDLEHFRTVKKVEGLNTALQYGADFYEISVAENSLELYTAFKSIVAAFFPNSANPPKRKFSVSKMFLGNSRLGRSNSHHPTVRNSQASIVNMAYLTPTNDADTTKALKTMSPCRDLKTNQPDLNQKPICFKSKTFKSNRTASDSLSTGFCNLKSKIIEFNSLKKRFNSPPVCSM